MTRIVYVNGSYMPYAQSRIHVEDRGFQFADSVYEVMEVKDGLLIDETRHMTRLKRSLDELSIALPMSMKALGLVLRETVRRNGVRDGSVYIQISRGAAKRDFVFPSKDLAPTIVCIARHNAVPKSDATSVDGIAVISMPDIRWKRPDIKSTALLPNALAREAAKKAGAKEAWLVDEQGFVTEGAASNAWIINKMGQLQTRPAEEGILRGITRTVVLDMAKDLGLEVLEKPFTIDEAKAANEAFVTAATALVMPVIRIDDQKIANGLPGPKTLHLRSKFHLYAEQSR